MKNNAELVFFSKWLKSPLSVASVTPSSSQLAKAMASGLPETHGIVVELGGGTGPVTQALLHAGVWPDELVVIERDQYFYRFLQRRFPELNILCGDALQMRSLIEETYAGLPVRAVVSGLPLLSMKPSVQKELLNQAMHLTDGGPFIQFSYSLVSPLKKTIEEALKLKSRCSARVWLNVPPAKVWIYHQDK